MTNKEAIELLKKMPIVHAGYKEVIELACKSLEENDWTPIFDDDPESFPPVDDDGYSEKVLLSFSNCNLPFIGEYRIDKNGGAFYEGDDDDPLILYGLYVNAWKKLPDIYREE